MEQNTTSTSWRTVDAVRTSCRILNTLSEMGNVGVTELANHLGLSKAGVHSHLATLEQNRLVVNEGDSYRISLFFLDFAEAAMNQVQFYDVISEELDSLAEETGEVAQFMVEEHGLGVYLYKTGGSSAVQTSSYVGNRKHLHCTALGKAILAHLDDERREEIIGHRGLPGQTPNTITDVETLETELNEIRDKGYALDDEEVLKGLKCVAAPIRNMDDELIGSISVSAPTSRMDEQMFKDKLPRKVTHTANIIEIQINAAQFTTVHEP